MIAHVIGVPASTMQNRLPPAHDFFEICQFPFLIVPLTNSGGFSIDKHMLKLEYHIKLVTIRSHISQRLLRPKSRSLANRHGSIRFQDHVIQSL
ncbi:hypothetical protein D3C76_1343270 [compost metagenome]